MVAQRVVGREGHVVQARGGVAVGVGHQVHEQHAFEEVVRRARSHAGRGFRPTPIRARVGLAMRRSMNFGSMPDAESVLRAHGLSLAPMAIGEGGLSIGGTSVLATAQASDLDSGALKGLVVPAGAADEAGDAALADAISRACAKGAPVLAFGEGVAATLRALGRPAGPFADAPAVVVSGDDVQPLADADALGAAAGRIH